MDIQKRLLCYGIHEWQAKVRVNVIGAIVGGAFITLSVFTCYVNSDVFYAWLTQDLLPKDSVIVMDNASFHKRSDMIEAIDERGFICDFLPPYSPDLNPIEKEMGTGKINKKKKRCSLDKLFSEQIDYATLY
ncbi:transposase [Pseudoalteromonas sp. NBT06-2]|uniref:transposase n=1 Tax=Pseudoalteromonas sp. NBT06-2 TaxID=2025950 RepID=UPI001BB0C6F7|nr:transposase [Pseudoalteromonas sp. NBT06-2]